MNTSSQNIPAPFFATGSTLTATQPQAQTLFIASAFCLALWLSGNPAQAQTILAASHFDNPAESKEGWTGIENLEATPRTVSVYNNPTNGVTGGCLGMVEKSGDGTTMFFAAPSRFLGNQLLAYGGSLEFDTRQFATGNYYYGFDVLLRSGTNQIGYMTGRIPSSSWTHCLLRLTEDDGWIDIHTRERATRAEMLQVLSTLDSVLIRAEYSGNNYDETQVDNVLLTAGTPELHIEQIEPGRIEVSWSARWEHFRLEVAEQENPEAWKPVDRPIHQRSGSRFVILDGTGAQWLFRMVTP